MMKKIIFIILISVLYSCQNSGEKLSDLKSKFTKEIPDFINLNNTDELELVTVTDENTIGLIAHTIHSGKSDSDIKEIIQSSIYYLFTYTNIHESYDRYMVIQERGCQSTLFSIITDKSGNITDVNSSMRNDCERVYEVVGNFQKNGDFSIKTRTEAYFLPELNIQQYTFSEDGKVIEESYQELQSGVCLWEKLAVRETPSDKGKYLSNLSLGESIWGMSESKVDEASSKKNEYTKILLSDGTVGWSRSDLLTFDAIPMAIESATTIYSRPDVLTKTDVKFSSLDIVAGYQITGDNEWVKVKGKPTGEKWFKEGWIKMHDVAKGKGNIALAAFAKTIDEETDNNRSEQLSAVLGNPDLQKAKLFTAFQKKFGIYGSEEESLAGDSPIRDFLSLFPDAVTPYMAEYPDPEKCVEISMTFKTEVLGLSEEDAGYLDYCAHSKIIGDYVDLVFVADIGMNSTMYLFTFTKDGTLQEQFRMHHMSIPNAPEREELKAIVNEDFSIELNYWSGKWVDENGNDSDGSQEGDKLEETIRIGKYVIADDGSIQEVESTAMNSKDDLSLFR